MFTPTTATIRVNHLSKMARAKETEENKQKSVVSLQKKTLLGTLLDEQREIKEFDRDRPDLQIQ